MYAPAPEIKDYAPLINTHRNLAYFEMIEFYYKFGENFKLSHDLIFLWEEERGENFLDC